MLHSEGQLWPFFEALLLWRLRERAVQSATSLVQLLAILLPDKPESKLEEFADDILESKGRGILAVLDGVDEFVERNNSYVSRLLSGDVLSEACLLATSRPCEAARKLFDSALSVSDANVELLGLSERQVDAFIDERLGTKLAPKLKELLDKSPELASLMSVPLLCVLVCQVFESSPDLSLSTRTCLYSALVLLVLGPAVDENHIAASDGEKKFLNPSLKDAQQLPVGVARKLLMDHAKIAWSAHKMDKMIFDTDFILDITQWESLAPLDAGVLDCYFSHENDLTEVRQYSFQHLTIQEFLAAFYPAETMSDDDALQATLTSLCKDTHSNMVLQFLAGLLEKKHHSVFFSHLNQWLHDPQLRNEDVLDDRLHMCLLCAQEACEGDVDSFPDQLILPKYVDLRHVTAAELKLLNSAVQKSSTLEGLWLYFDELGEVGDSEKVGRVKRQTHSAMASLATAVSHNTSLLRIEVYGPKYKVFEDRSLANLVRNSRLISLRVLHSGVGDAEVGQLSSELQRNLTLTELTLSNNNVSDAGMYAMAAALTDNTALRALDMSANTIGEAGMHALADVLTHNTTLERLRLVGNRYGGDTAAYLRQQLAHIEDLYV